MKQNHNHRRIKRGVREAIIYAGMFVACIPLFFFVLRPYAVEFRSSNLIGGEILIFIVPALIYGMRLMVRDVRGWIKDARNDG